jgi:hypothetical protein
MVATPTLNKHFMYKLGLSDIEKMFQKPNRTAEAGIKRISRKRRSAVLNKEYLSFLSQVFGEKSTSGSRRGGVGDSTRDQKFFEFLIVSHERVILGS